jgi:23S rRNA A1618 N6-methylase RlmF
MRVGLPEKIFAAISEIQSSSDPEIFVKKLLRDTLQWPVVIDDIDEFDFDDIGYDWHAELESMGLKSEEGITGLFQIAPFPGWPMGMFVVKFGSNSIFTKGRGMTTPLRNLLRNVIEKARPDEPWDRWAQDQLLFMCHHEHQYFQFVRFTEMDGENLPKLQTFGWGPEDDYRTLCTDNLPFFFYNPNHSQQEVIEELGKAFDVERVSKRFYDDYKETFKQFKQDMIQQTKIADSDEIHQHVQLIFNRFLFLRFLEKKGWMDFGEDSKYLYNLFKHSNEQSSQFYSDHFLPMVLKGLCSKGHQSSDKYGVVPLIGGGLFEQSPLDKKINKLPNNLFKPIIGSKGLLYKYNFTVLESTPLDVQVAIDPEMIGTMFEELVTDRDGKGAFYTPRIVVSYMCREGLKSILEEKTGVSTEKLVQLIDKERSETITEVEAKKIREELDGLKAIDPACGSGAYLLGLLQEIVKIHENLSTIPGELKRTKYQLKLHIISRSIYGVDIDSFATQIAMLRLWLSLAVESDEPIQLPNLDFNIETGCSLRAPDPSISTFDITGAYAAADKLAEQMEHYVTTSLEHTLEVRKEINKTKQEIIKLLREKNHDFSSADFRINFAGVFSKNRGFDLVLANPPYVRTEDIMFVKDKTKNKKIKTELVKRYKSVAGMSDLYCFFYERFFQLLNPKGIQCVICSNTWLDNKFGKVLRDYILETGTVTEILESEVEKQFSTAEVNTVISFMKKGVNKKVVTKFTTITKESATSLELAGNSRTRRKIYDELITEELGSKSPFGIKWGATFLRPKSKHDEMMDLLKPHLREPKTFLHGSSYLNTGGCDKFFIITDFEKKPTCIEFSRTVKINNIEQKYSGFLEYSMITPIIKNATKASSNLLVEEGDCFCFTPVNLLTENAKSYIKWGESMGFNKKSGVKNKKVWYKPQNDMISGNVLIVPRTFSDRFNIYFNKNNLPSLRYYRIGLNPNLADAKRYLPFFFSSFFHYFMELRGNKGLGGGALDFYITDLLEWNLPIPLVSKETEILFKDAIKADFGDLRVEYSNPKLIPKSREQLDKAICLELGLSDDWLEWVRNETLLMMNNRYAKSKSSISRY